MDAVKRPSASRRASLFLSRPLLVAAAVLLLWGLVSHRSGPVWAGVVLLTCSVGLAALAGFAQARRRSRQIGVRCG